MTLSGKRSVWLVLMVIACALAVRSGAQGPVPTVASAPAMSAAGAAARAAAGPASGPLSTARALKVLADARQAMGGDKLAAVKTLVANGRARRVRGNNLQPIEFEMSIELPDRYVRKDEFPAEESAPTSTGFNGGELLQFPASPGSPAVGRAGGLPPLTSDQLSAQRATRVTTAKQEFVRFALGMFPDTFATYPLTFSFAAQAEAPQGKADVLDVKGAGNFTMRLFVNASTHLPIMASWQLPPSNVIVTVPGQPPPQTVAPGAVVVEGPPAPNASATAEEKDRYAKEVAALRTETQATSVEHRLYYADYRDVDGIQWPFRLRRAIGADTTEEISFDRFRINSRIDPKKFTSAK